MNDRGTKSLVGWLLPLKNKKNKTVDINFEGRVGKVAHQAAYLRFQ